MRMNLLAAFLVFSFPIAARGDAPAVEARAILAGGRVDSPPTIHKAMVLFGSADGRVTSLRLGDGALVWRFLAAPAELRTVALDRVESVWPVHGSVLVLDDVAYCSAGRSTWLDGGAVWGVRNKGNADGKHELFKKENRPFSAREKSFPDFRAVPASEVDPCVWKSDLPVRPTAMLKSGGHLFLGVAPVEIAAGDPHAAYEGRAGGRVWVCSESDGTRIAQYELESPVVWDGMAAANGRLYLSTTRGELLCLGRKE